MASGVALQVLGPCPTTRRGTGHLSSGSGFDGARAGAAPSTRTLTTRPAYGRGRAHRLISRAGRVRRPRRRLPACSGPALANGVTRAWSCTTVRKRVADARQQPADRLSAASGLTAALARTCKCMTGGRLSADATCVPPTDELSHGFWRPEPVNVALRVLGPRDGPGRSGPRRNARLLRAAIPSLRPGLEPRHLARVAA